MQSGSVAVGCDKPIRIPRLALGRRVEPFFERAVLGVPVAEHAPASIGASAGPERAADAYPLCACFARSVLALAVAACSSAVASLPAGGWTAKGDSTPHVPAE